LACVTIGLIALSSLTILLDLELIVLKLAPVHHARFDGGDKSFGCLQGTRVDLLASFFAWADDPNRSPILWLNGLGGTGKTTVCWSVCSRLLPNRVGASFFISRDSAERKDYRRIFHSIVYQLCSGSSQIRTAVVKALRDDRDVTTKSLSEQMLKLLAEPLKAMARPTQPVLLVIDALDECDMVNGQGGIFLPLLAQVVLRFGGMVKLFVTSREDQTIGNMFRGIKDNHGEHDTVQLHSLDQSVVQSDIRLYLKYQLGVIAAYCGIDHKKWPSEDVLSELLSRAGVLFVYAATIIRYLGNKNWDPTERLQELLGTSATESDPHEPYKMVDGLYMNVLDKAVEDKETNKELLCKRLRTVVGAIVLLQDPLGYQMLGSLLNISISNVFAVIRQLTAVLIVPNNDNATDPIRIFHPSFADFVLLRCPDDRLKINAGLQHGHLAQRCFAIMNQKLKYDICRIGDYSLLNSEVGDLQSRLGDHVSAELRYACKHWITHLIHSSEPDESLRNELKTFCSERLLHWVEVLSLLEALPSALIGLPPAIAWCQVSGSDCDITSIIDPINTETQRNRGVSCSATRRYRADGARVLSSDQLWGTAGVRECPGVYV
jgi:hypothetical protein